MVWWLARARIARKSAAGLECRIVHSRRCLAVRVPSPLGISFLLICVVLPLCWPDDEDPQAPRPQAELRVSSDVKCLAISRDGRSLAASSWAQPVVLWRRQGWSEWRPSLLFGQETSGARVVAFAPDGRSLACGNLDGTVVVHPLAAEERLRILDSGSLEVRALAFSPDGRTLATATSDSGIRIWNLERGGVEKVLRNDGGFVNALVFSPDGGKLVAGGEDGGVRLWTLSGSCEGETIGRHEGVVLAIAYHPRGGRIASAGTREGVVRLWSDTAGGNQGILPGTSEAICALAFAPDGALLALGGEHGRWTLCSLVGDGARRTIEAHQGWVKCLVFSSDGGTLVSAGNDGCIKLWRLAEVGLRDEPPAADRPVGAAGWERGILTSPTLLPERSRRPMASSREPSSIGPS